jgi:hypothetical protein
MSSAAVRGAAVVAVAILAAGCGGRSKAFTLSDAKRLAGVRPAAPGWTWPSTADESRVHAGAA